MFDRRCCLKRRSTAHCAALLLTGSGALAAAPPEVPIMLEESLLSHEPITKHAAGRPIPIFVAADDEQVTHAILHYRTKKRWRKTPMTRRKGLFRATIPCEAVERRDAVAYYIDALDEQGDVVDRVGSKKEPLEIELDKDTEFVAHFPKEPPPDACAAEAREGEPPAHVEAEKPGPPSEPWLWLSLSVVQDAQIAGGNDICSPSSQQDSGFACFRETGSQYLGTPLPGEGGKGSGFALATTRVLAGADIEAADPLTIGLRAGYAFGGGPKPAGGRAFLPLHVEARAAYWPSEAYSPSGFAPYFLLAGGIGQVDSSSSVTVTEDTSVLPPPSQLDNPETQRLDAWKKTGVGFAALGAGAFVALGKTHGFLFEIRGSTLFPSPGIAAALSAGYAVAP